MVGAFILVFAFVLLLSSSNASAAGPSYTWKNVDSSTNHWTEAGSPYIVNRTITVPVGVTLTVDPNVVVKVDPGQQIIVSGSLVANGEASRMVTFTKNNTVTAWAGITGTANSLINMNYVNLNNDTAVTIQNTGIFTNSKFSNAAPYGFYFQIVSKDGNLTFTNCDFSSTGTSTSEIMGSITVSADASNTRTYNVPISITNSYFATSLSGTAITIIDNVNSHNNALVTLNSNTIINNDRFNIGSNSAIVVQHDLSPYDNSTAVMNGDDTINNNVFNCGPAIVYTDVIAVPDLANPSTKHYNAGSVAGSVRILNNDMRGVQVYGVFVYEQVIAYGESASTINVPVTVSGNNITSSGDGIQVQKQLNAYEDSTASISGSVTIDSNRIFQAVNGAYISSSAIAAASSDAAVMIDSDLSFTNNVMTTISGRGLYVYDRASAAGSRASSFSSAVTATGNTVSQDAGTMVQIDRSGFNSEDSSNLTVSSGILVTNDLATSCRNMVIINLNYMANGRSGISATGDVTVNANAAVNAIDGGITLLFTPNAAGNGTVTTNVNILSSGNTFQVSNLYAMDVERTLTVTGSSTGSASGTISILGNDLVDEHNVAILARNYVNAYNGSKGTVTGDLVLANNTVLVNDRSAVTLAIGAYAEVKLAKMATTASYLGNVLMADNSITVTNLSLLVSPYDGVYADFYARAFVDVTGSNQGNKWANASLGDIQILRNTVQLNGNNAGGIEFDPDLTAYATHGGSAKVLAGTQLVAGNHVKGAGNSLEGIKMDLDNLNSATIDGNATVLSGSISLQANAIGMTGNSSKGVNVYNFYANDIYAYAHSKGLASFRIDGGLKLLSNTITMKGNANFGVYFNNNAQKSYAKVGYLNGQAVMDLEMGVYNNQLTMSGLNDTGITFVNYNMNVAYTDGNVTFSADVTVRGNNIGLDASTGTGINANVVLSVDPLSFNGHAAVNADLSITNNIVTRGQIGIHIAGSGVIVVHVSGNQVTGTYGSAIAVENSNAVLESNTLSNNQGNGILLNNSQASTHLVIGNNTIDHNANRGLSIVNSRSVTLYNGLFRDNINYDIYVPAGSQVKWVIDSAASVKDGDVRFFGSIEVMRSGVLTMDSVNDLTLGMADTGVTQLTVDLGGSLVVQNSNIHSDNGAGLFLVYGKLTMTSSTESDWSEIYLANTSSAQITRCTISDNDRNGIYIGGSNPTISSCTISSNGMDGVFIDSGSKASVKSCLIISNERGVYARNCSLDNVVDNIFATNTVAGVYTEGAVGKIHANIFLMNKNEIFVLNSAVSIEDNQIGYAHLVDQMARYTPLISLLSYIESVAGEDSLMASESVNSTLPFGISTDMTSLILDHVGLYAVNSHVVASDNTYGMLAYAVYAENSTISFNDTVQSNTIIIQWLNGNLDAKNITIPTFVYNGIYLIGSTLSMNGASIQCMNDALFLDDSCAAVSHCALNASRFDIYTVHQCNVSIGTSTMDGKLKVEDNGKITWLNQFTIVVKDADGHPVSGAPVTVVDAQGNLIASGNTSSSGQFRADVAGWVQTAGGRQNVTAPYWVNATVNGKSVSQTADGSLSQTITAQEPKGLIDTVLLPLLLIIALIVAIVVVVVVIRVRRK